MSKKQAIFAFVITLLVAYILSLFGCNPLKKTQQYLFKHPEFSAEYCAEQFPVKDSVTVIIDSTVYDTLTVIEQLPVGDTTVSGDTVTVIKTNVVYKTITKTIKKDSIIYRRDAAEERRLQLALQECQKNNNELLKKYEAKDTQLASWKSKARKRFWLIIFLLGAGTAYAAVKVKKSFFG